MPWHPQRRHHRSSPVIRHANTAWSGQMRWPVTSRPRSSRRVNALRSGRSKIVLGMSRSFRWTVSEPPSSEDLDPYPATTRPTPPTTPTPSIMKSRQSCNGGSLEAQLSDRPADRPHTQTRPGSTHLVVLLDEGRDLAGAFAAHPAPFMPPDPHRNPGPRRVDHLHHHTPITLSDHPTTQAANQLVARLNIEHQSI